MKARIHPVRNPPMFIGGRRLRRLTSNGVNANCKAKMEAIKTRIDTNNATAKTLNLTEKTQKEKTRLPRRSPAFRGINSATLRGMVTNG